MGSRGDDIALSVLDMNQPIAVYAEGTHERPLESLSGHGLHRVSPDLGDVHGCPESTGALCRLTAASAAIAARPMHAALGGDGHEARK